MLIMYNSNDMKVNRSMHVLMFNKDILVLKVDLYDLVIFDHFWPSDWRGNQDEF